MRHSEPQVRTLVRIQDPDPDPKFLAFKPFKRLLTKFSDPGSATCIRIHNTDRWLMLHIPLKNVAANYFFRVLLNIFPSRYSWGGGVPPCAGGHWVSHGQEGVPQPISQAVRLSGVPCISNVLNPDPHLSDCPGSGSILGMRIRIQEHRNWPKIYK